MVKEVHTPILLWLEKSLWSFLEMKHKILQKLNSSKNSHLFNTNYHTSAKQLHKQHLIKTYKKENFKIQF